MFAACSPVAPEVLLFGDLLCYIHVSRADRRACRRPESFGPRRDVKVAEIPPEP